MPRWIRRAEDYLLHLAGLNLQVWAANASFFLLISAFPAVMLLMTLLKLLPLDAGDILQMTQPFLPPATQELAAYLVEDLYASNTGAALSLSASAVLALWSASRGVLAMLGGINAAYETRDTRRWLWRRILSMIYTVGLLVALVLTLALHAFGQRLQDLLARAFPALDGVVAGIMPLRTSIVLLALVLFFLTIYAVFPNRRMRLWRQLPGAVLAAVGWLVFSSCYSLYLEHSSGLSSLYGSLTAVVVTMLWLYFCMCIVFFGAALNELLARERFWARRVRRAPAPKRETARRN